MKKNIKNTVDVVLPLLLTFATLVGFSIVAVLFVDLTRDPSHFIENNSRLLSAFFILLASGIASGSVMKSIQAQRELEDKRNKRDWELEQRKTNRDMYDRYMKVYSNLQELFRSYIINDDLSLENIVAFHKENSEYRFFPTELKEYLESCIEVGINLLNAVEERDYIKTNMTLPVSMELTPEEEQLSPEEILIRHHAANQAHIHSLRQQLPLKIAEVDKLKAEFLRLRNACEMVFNKFLNHEIEPRESSL